MTSKFQEWLENCPVKYTITPEGLYEFDVNEPPPIIPVIDTGAGGIDDDILNPKKHPKIGLQ